MMQGLSRSLRRATRRARRKRAMELNIVSMIDILTVLVFFLLVNATGVSVLGVNLPSTSTSPPQKHTEVKVVIHPTSLVVADENGPLQALPNTATGYDLGRLAELLAKVKDKNPDNDKVTLLLEPGIPYDVLVQVMDVVRLQPGEPGHPPRDLFPQISMGDAPADTAAAGGKP